MSDGRVSAAKSKGSPGKKRSRVSLGAKGPSQKGQAPSFLPPQLAQLATRPPIGEAWVHEIKFDGYRLLASLNEGDVSLRTRSDNDWTHRFTDLATTLKRLKVRNALMDGEVVHRAADGAMRFHALQNALHESDGSDLHYFIFDLLFLNGRDVRSLPLLERKQLLSDLLSKAPPSLHYSEHFIGPGSEILRNACQMQLEGIVSKLASEPYRAGRGPGWIKSKCTREQEIVIGGFTLQPKHPGQLGAFLGGVYEGARLIFAGKVGTGFSRAEGAALLKKLRSLETARMGFEAVPTAARRGAHWVKPQLIAQVHFTEWTPDGAMRHPSFKGLREDKPARSVVREKAAPPPRAADGAGPGTRKR